MSQTEGAELPDLKERVKGEVGEYRERLIDFVISQHIELEFKESIAPALGMSYGGRIAILPGQAAADQPAALGFQSAADSLCQFVHDAFANRFRLCQIAPKILCQIILKVTVLSTSSTEYIMIHDPFFVS